MKVDVDMDPGNKFHVSGWYATTPDFVVNALQKQLEAATAIWPELEAYKIGTRTGRAGGARGGHARAEALSPERRTEIASDAAKARWGKSAVADAE